MNDAVIHLRQGDRLPSGVFQLLRDDDQKPIDLTDSRKVTMMLMRIDAPGPERVWTIGGPATVLDPHNGVVMYSWSVDDTAYPGEIVGQFAIEWSDGSVASAPNVGRIRVKVAPQVGEAPFTLNDHVIDPIDAHDASAISYIGQPGMSVDIDTVQEALDLLWTTGKPGPVGPPGAEGPPGVPGDIVTVKQFGAKGDGLTDDTAAIQRAVDAATPAIIFPPGDYLVSAAINITGPRSVIGWGATIIGTGGVYDSLTCDGDDITIEGLIFKGNRPTRTGFAVGVSIANGARGRVRRCTFLDFAGMGVNLYAVTDCWVTDCVFDTMDYSGVRVAQTVCSDLLIARNTFVATCLAGVAGHAAIFVDGDGLATGIVRVIVQGNVITSCGKVGIGVGGRHVLIQGNVIENGGSLSQGGEAIALSGCDMVVSGNYVRGYPAAGVLWFGLTQLTNDKLSIIGNDIEGCAQGIVFAWAGPDVNMRDVLVTANRLVRNGFGIQSYGDPAGANQTWDHVVIVGNVIVGNTTQDMSLGNPEAVALDNITTVGRGTNNRLYARAQPIYGEAGTYNVPGTSVAMHLRHLNQGPSSPGTRIRALLGFDLLDDRSIGGWELEAGTTYGTSVALHAITTGDSYTTTYRPLTIYGSAVSQISLNQAYMELDQIANPGNPAAGKVRLNAGTSGGNPALMAVFPTGAKRVLTEGDGLDQATADGRYVNITGDTMTGDLQWTGGTPYITPGTIYTGRIRAQSGPDAISVMPAANDGNAAFTIWNPTATARVAAWNNDGGLSAGAAQFAGVLYALADQVFRGTLTMQLPGQNVSYVRLRPQGADGSVALEPATVGGLSWDADKAMTFDRTAGKWKGAQLPVAKSTAPVAADYGASAIPTGAIWVQTP